MGRRLNCLRPAAAHKTEEPMKMKAKEQLKPGQNLNSDPPISLQICPGRRRKAKAREFPLPEKIVP